MQFRMAATAVAGAWMALALAWGAGAAPAAAREPLWAPGLQSRLQQIERDTGGRLGVHVHHLGRDEVLSYRGTDPWYLASGVKVPVAIAVLRDVEAGRLRLDQTLRLLATDYVDGAGQTNNMPVGSELPVAFLLEQMIIYSDNTATDMLIRAVGLERINALANELMGTSDFVMTSLAGVRRLAYGQFDPRAADLTSEQLFALKRAGTGPARVMQLATILGVSPDQLLMPDMDSAFEAYYAGHVNTATLASFSRLLEHLIEGRALGTFGTDHLLGLMARIRTGDHRLSAALPAASRFAHKTGTQHRRACDLGIVTTPVAGRAERVVVTACVREVTLQADGDRALREVGAALVDAGVITLPTLAGRSR